MDSRGTMKVVIEWLAEQETRHSITGFHVEEEPNLTKVYCQELEVIRSKSSNNNWMKTRKEIISYLISYKEKHI